MGISSYILSLREHVGNDLLFLPAVAAIVVDAQDRVLLHRATDDGKWYTIGGAIDPGEQPAAAVVREALEETGLHVEPVRVLAVNTSPEMTYPNGHRAQYVSIAFLCRVVGGTLRVSDDESLEVRFFGGDELPELRPDQLQRVLHALSGMKARSLNEWGRMISQQSILKSLGKIKGEYERSSERDSEIVCRVGVHLNCAVLKLQKRTWTNDDLTQMANQTGIFFSIWTTAEGLKKGRAEYNVHSFKLRNLKGYRLTSRDFCARFRNRFGAGKMNWPNVSMNFGPLTLMQGWFEFDAETFGRRVLDLMIRFDLDVASTIDDLLRQNASGA